MTMTAINTNANIQAQVVSYSHFGNMSLFAINAEDRHGAVLDYIYSQRPEWTLTYSVNDGVGMVDEVGYFVNVDEVLEDEFGTTHPELIEKALGRPLPRAKWTGNFRID